MPRQARGSSRRKLLRDSDGAAYAVEIGGYFEGAEGRVDEWLFSEAPSSARDGLREFRVPRFHQPLPVWLNRVVAAGFQIEQIAEPCVRPETAARFPAVADTRGVVFSARAGKEARIEAAIWRYTRGWERTSQTR